MFVCIDCGARYPVYRPLCVYCGADKRVIVEPMRPTVASHSPVDVGFSSAADLVKSSWTMVESKAYQLHVSVGSIVLVWGVPGAGKSTWVARYIDGLSGAVVYASVEEKIGPSLASRLLRCGVKRRDFYVVDTGDPSTLIARCRAIKARALAIDSVSVTSIQPAELRDLLAATGVDVLVLVAQATKSGVFAGSQSLAHEADVVLRVEQSRFHVTKSRFESTKNDVSV